MVGSGFLTNMIINLGSSGRESSGNFARRTTFHEISYDAFEMK
jgi:hypothetical protein